MTTLVTRITQNTGKAANKAQNDALFARLHSGDRSAMTELQLANLPMVIKIASKWDHHNNNGLDLDALIAEGCIGLCKAIEGFDPSTGFAFSSYAYPAIENEIARAISTQAGIMNLPINGSVTLGKIANARAALESGLGRDATAEEIAEASGLSANVVQKTLDARAPSSQLIDGALPAPDGYEDFVPDELITDDYVVEVMQEMEDQETRDRVAKALRVLTIKEARAVRLVYGFEGDPLSQAEAARAMNLTRSRVNQLLHSAHKTLAPLLDDVVN